MSETVSAKLRKIAKEAGRDPEMVFTRLMHHIDTEFLGVAFKQLKRNAKAGIDGVTVQEYEQNLEENLQDLHAWKVAVF